MDLGQLDSILQKYAGNKGGLIPILQQTQDLFGYLPEDAMQYIADHMGIAASRVYGVATFYTQFRFNPMGKYIIRICHGTACHVSNADGLDILIRTKLGIEIGDTTKDGLFTVLSVSCLGCCSLAPAVMINDKTFGNLNSDKFSKIIDEYIENEQKVGK